MGLTKITKEELSSWKESYAASIRGQENETQHCTLFLRELKQLVDYIEKRNQEEEKKEENERRRIGCVRIYFVRPTREFQSEGDKTMKFVYNPLLVKKENHEEESYPQMRIAMVPVYGERRAPSEPAILKDYSENGDDFTCLYPGTALSRDDWGQDVERRKNERKMNKITRTMNEVQPDGNMTSQIQEMVVKVEKEEDERSKILEDIVKDQDRISVQIKALEAKLKDNDVNIRQQAVDNEIAKTNGKVNSLRVAHQASLKSGVINARQSAVEAKILRKGDILINNKNEHKAKLLNVKDEEGRKRVADEIIIEVSNFEVEHSHNAIKEPSHLGEHTGVCPPGGCQ